MTSGEATPGKDSDTGTPNLRVPDEPPGIEPSLGEDSKAQDTPPPSAETSEMKPMLDDASSSPSSAATSGQSAAGEGPQTPTTHPRTVVPALDEAIEAPLDKRTPAAGIAPQAKTTTDAQNLFSPTRIDLPASVSTGRTQTITRGPSAAASGSTAIGQRRERRRRAWKLTGKVLSSIIAVVSLIVGVIAVVPILTRDATNFSALEVIVIPYPATSTDWAVPRTAPFNTFPAGAEDTCSDAQRDWLRTYGTQITSRILVDMRNTASEGPMLTVKDFRIEGERTDVSPAAVRVICDTEPDSSVVIQTARLKSTTDESRAVLQASAFGATTEGLKDTPVAWNLAPGETGLVIIELSAPTTLAGHLTATVLNSDEARHWGFDEFDIALTPLVEDGRVYLRAERELVCVDASGDAPTECEAQHLIDG